MSFNPLLSKWYHLYTHQTRAEEVIEPAIAALGLPYRFQHIVGVLYPDFVVFTNGLNKPGVVIEVDGPSHYTEKGKAADVLRTAKLNAKGWIVVRCANAEATQDPHGAVARMMREATAAKEAQ